MFHVDLIQCVSYISLVPDPTMSTREMQYGMYFLAITQAMKLFRSIQSLKLKNILLRAVKDPRARMVALGWYP